jgi:hypothetical protein
MYKHDKSTIKFLEQFLEAINLLSIAKIMLKSSKQRVMIKIKQNEELF